MLFSFNDFERTKQRLVEEFKKTPEPTLDHEEQLPNEPAYKKVLDSLIYIRRNRNLRPPQSTRLKSAAPRQGNTMFQRMDCASETAPETFFLTDNPLLERHSLTEKSVEITSDGRNSIEFDEEKQRIVWLNVQSSEEKFKQSNYLREITELESSIRRMKKRNNQIEQDLLRNTKKENKYQRQILKRQSSLNCLCSRNKYVEEKLMGTAAFFNKSLKNICFTKRSLSKKTAQMTDDLVEAILIRDKHRERLKEQNIEIKNLTDKQSHLKEKLKEFEGLLKKSSHFRVLNAIKIFIKENSYGQVEKMKKMVSELHSDKSEPIQDLKEFNFNANSRDFIRVFRRMKSDAEKFELIFKSKVDDQKQLQQDLRQISGRIESFPREPLREATEKLNALEEQERKKREKKFERICESLVQAVERCRFFIKKEIKCLQKIIENWLKFDQSAINFISNVMDSYIQVAQVGQDIIPYARVKDMLVGSFENWANYLPSLSLLEQNPLLNQSLSKEKITSCFRRIIKTKEVNREVPTELLFEQFTKQYFQERINKCLRDIRKFIELGVKIHKYSSKYQVLIVNSSNRSEGHQRKQTDGCNDKNYQTPSESVSQTQSRALIPSRREPSPKEEDMQLFELILGYQMEIKKVNRAKVSLQLG